MAEKLRKCSRVVMVTLGCTVVSVSVPHGSFIVERCFAVRTVPSHCERCFGAALVPVAVTEAEGLGYESLLVPFSSERVVQPEPGGFSCSALRVPLPTVNLPSKQRDDFCLLSVNAEHACVLPWHERKRVGFLCVKLGFCREIFHTENGFCVCLFLKVLGTQIAESRL